MQEQQRISVKQVQPQRKSHSYHDITACVNLNHVDVRLSTAPFEEERQPSCCEKSWAYLGFQDLTPVGEKRLALLVVGLITALFIVLFFHLGDFPWEFGDYMPIFQPAHFILGSVSISIFITMLVCLPMMEQCKSRCCSFCLLLVVVALLALSASGCLTLLSPHATVLGVRWDYTVYAHPAPGERFVLPAAVPAFCNAQIDVNVTGSGHSFDGRQLSGVLSSGSATAFDCTASCMILSTWKYPILCAPAYIPPRSSSGAAVDSVPFTATAAWLVFGILAVEIAYIHALVICTRPDVGQHVCVDMAVDVLASGSFMALMIISGWTWAFVTPAPLYAGVVYIVVAWVVATICICKRRRDLAYAAAYSSVKASVVSP
eukprot:TRINITY_DN461_c0_g1_i1.p1 TRINITY_DN461_c0_g1~~TRINITY_DN461_c0_g1_i1.p1  ORF type:complete len:374 (-),score=43.04 TRINITY_DN461_c0_g1_i1:41-1162(-)